MRMAAKLKTTLRKFMAGFHYTENNRVFTKFENCSDKKDRAKSKGKTSARRRGRGWDCQYSLNTPAAMDVGRRNSQAAVLIELCCVAEMDPLVQ